MSFHDPDEEVVGRILLWIEIQDGSVCLKVVAFSRELLERGIFQNLEERKFVLSIVSESGTMVEVP